MTCSIFELDHEVQRLLLAESDMLMNCAELSCLNPHMYHIILDSACSGKRMTCSCTSMLTVQVFESHKDLALAAVACVYAAPSGTNWILPAEMLTEVKHALAARSLAADSLGPGAANAQLVIEGAAGELDQVSSPLSHSAVCIRSHCSANVCVLT